MEDNNNNPYGVNEGESKGHKMLGILLLSIFIFMLFSISYIWFDQFRYFITYIKHFILILLFTLLSQ